MANQLDLNWKEEAYLERDGYGLTGTPK